MPDFSIITPVLNQASTIEATIESIAIQNANAEHIIIDGGSTDGTVDIIKKHQSKLAYWVSEPDSGQPEAINKGLATAKGIFFNWLNADDVLTPNALSVIESMATSSVEVVVGKCQHVDETGNVLETGFAKIWPSIEATLGNYSMGQPSVFYRTEVVRELGGVNPNLHLCMDMDLWFRYILENGIDRIKFIDEILSRFLVNPAGKSGAQAQQMRVEKYGIYRALLSENSSSEIVDEFLNQFEIPKGVSYQTTHLSNDVVLSNFAWHLLVDAYQNQELDKASSLFDVVNKGSRLTTKEQLEWKARLASSKLLRK